MRKIKKHLGLIIILIIVVAFPTSLSNQTKLNMRVVVTGIAVDKINDEFEVTAQIVKTPTGSKGAGTSASVDFITDKGKTIASAVSKLAFKAGKAAAFSHTNYVILGKGMLEDDVTVSLDYFVRDKIIKNSAMVLFAEDKAGDEIKKTKSTDLSVGIGLQQVFLFKEHESDGVMTTMMDFLNDNRGFSKTAISSVLKLESSQEQNTSNSSSSDSSEGQTSQSSTSQSSGGEGSEGSSSGSGSESGKSGGENQGQSSGESGSSGGSSGASGESESQYFKALAPILMFVDGKFVGKLETEDEVSGFMLASQKAKAIDVSFELSDENKLKDAKIDVNIKNMRVSHKVRFENKIPCLDINIIVYNAEINEVQAEDIVSSLSEEEYKKVKEGLSKEISKRVATCFKKTKETKADIFEAYEKAYKFHYKTTTKYYKSSSEFLEKLKLNVSVDVRKLDY